MGDTASVSDLGSLGPCLLLHVSASTSYGSAVYVKKIALLSGIYFTMSEISEFLEEWGYDEYVISKFQGVLQFNLFWSFHYCTGRLFKQYLLVPKKSVYLYENFGTNYPLHPFHTKKFGYIRIEILVHVGVTFVYQDVVISVRLMLIDQGIKFRHLPQLTKYTLEKFFTKAGDRLDFINHLDNYKKELKLVNRMIY